MSDLAPFVAAALRDKALLDLMEENKRLRLDYNRSRKVQITSPDGQTIYAQGQFDDDGQEHGNINLWQVNLRQLTPCPLRELPRAELRLGGSRLFGMNSDQAVLLDPMSRILEDGRHLARLSFCSGQPDVIWVSLIIEGQTEAQWASTETQWNAHINEAENPTVTTRDFLSFVGGDSSQGMEVSFADVRFSKDSVRELVESLPKSKTYTPQQLSELSARQNFEMDVMHRMRMGGNEESFPSFQDDVDQIMDILSHHGINELNEAYEHLVDFLVSFQLSAKQVGRQDSFSTLMKRVSLSFLLEGVREIDAARENNEDV